MAVTQAQIDEISADFDELLADVLAAVPHDPRIDMAVMIFNMAKASVLTVLHQRHAAQPPFAGGA
jgi:hypothetical protein